MPRQAEISPNVPDVMPDYVDLDDLPKARVEPSPTSAMAPPEMEGPPPEYMDLECVHSLNAEVEPAAASMEPEDFGAEEEEEGDESASVETPPELPEFPETAPELEIEAPTEPPAEVFSAPASAPEAASQHRDGECIPNTPDIPPDYVAEEDTVKPVAAAVPEPEAGRGLAIPSWLRWGYFAATLVIVSLFGVFVFSQTISSLALAATLPGWAQYALLIPLGLCALVVLAVCAALAVSWMRLRAVRQISVAALEDLRRRAETRKDGLEHFQAARAELENYLRDYPAAGEGARRLMAAGMGDLLLEKLVREREYLFGRTTDSRSWLEEFRNHFQSCVDRAARERINSWSLKAAACVMASPLPLLDAALILGISIKMIKDLCVLYNVRAGTPSALVLFNRAVFISFVAGVAEDASEAAGDMLGDEVTGMFGETALGTVGSGFSRMIAPKLGEGALNALFMRRLGKATVRLLQPLRPK